MKVAVGCDHAGLDLKREIVALLGEMGLECIDFGTDSPQSVDYPDFGEKVSFAVSRQIQVNLAHTSPLNTVIYTHLTSLSKTQHQQRLDSFMADL